MAGVTAWSKYEYFQTMSTLVMYSDQYLVAVTLLLCYSTHDARLYSCPCLLQSGVFPLQSIKLTQWIDGLLMWSSVVVVVVTRSLVLVGKGNQLSAALVQCFWSNDRIRLQLLPWLPMGPCLCTCNRLPPCSVIANDASVGSRWWPERRDWWLRLWVGKKSFLRSNWTMVSLVVQRRWT